MALIEFPHFAGAGGRKWKSLANLMGEAHGGNEGVADAKNKDKRHLSGGIPPLCKKQVLAHFPPLPSPLRNRVWL